ncbi:MAG TPA: site-specific integrase [Gammaproteobacteria bacterium]|jgi:site-specific recombinase XerD|nr:site-specific integrase [Gammaproteobacteria bacterium]
MSDQKNKLSNKQEIQNIESHPLQYWGNNLYIQAATSENTRQAYQADIRHFETWGGKLPTTPQQIVEYLHFYATQLNPRTLSRRLIAIKHWHHYQGFPDPVSHPAIQKTIAGIMRVHAKPKKKAYPLLPEDLILIVKNLKNQMSFSAVRDNALLQIGFYGAFRRSELVKIKVEDIQWKNQGIDILIPQSKTDQTHVGQYCAIPFGKDELCPIATLNHWLKISNITQGAIFREIKKGGKLGENALSALSVNHILKKRAEEAGIAYAKDLSSHSLRRGLATSASRFGAELPAIMRQGRWKNVNTVIEYIEATARFDENAASSILNKIDNK